MSNVYKSASVDQYTECKLWTVADGLPKTDAVYNTSGLSIKYQIGNAAIVSVTVAGSPAPASMSAGGSHADWGIYHVGNGWYKIGLADAVLATAGTRVRVWIELADCDSGPTDIYVGGYDGSAAALGAAVAGSEMDLVDAPNATAVTAIQNGLATPTNITAATGIVLSGVTHTGAIIPRVTLVDTTTTNTDMRGTDGANTTAPATPANVSAVTTTLAALLPVALVGGRIDASVGAVATDAINAAAIAADAVTEIQDGLATQTSLDAKLTAARLGVLTSLESMIVTNVYTADSMANVALAAGGDATVANQDLLLARLATGPIRITSTVTAGGVVNLRVGDDYVGTRIAITFDDAGGTIMTYMQSASVASVIFGAGRNTEINEIYGTVDPDDGVYDSGAGTSTVYPQIARADITGPVSDDYGYQIKAIDTAGRHITKIAGSVVVLAKNAFPV